MKIPVRVLLKELIRVEYGSALRESERDSQGPYPVFGSSGVVGRHSQAFVKNPTIIIGRKGSVGNISYAPEGGWPIDTTFFTEIIDPKCLDNRYLYYALSAAQLVTRAITTSIPGLSRDEIYRTKIALLPLLEQRRIVAVLDKVDDLRKRRQSAVSVAGQLFQSTFIDIFGDTSVNSKRWPIGRLKDLCARIVDCPHSTPIYSGGQTRFPCIRTSDLQDGFLDWATTKYVEETEYKTRILRHKPVAGDVLYSREGERFGIAAIVPEGKTLCLGQRMMLFHPATELATGEFLWGLLNSKAVYHQAAARVGGSTSPHVNVGEISNFKVIKPPVALQKQFSGYVKRLAGMLGQLHAGETEADCLFQGLLQHYFARLA